AFLLIPVIGIRNLFLISLVPGSIAVVVLVYFVVDKGGLKKTTSIFKNAGKVLNRKYTAFLIVIGIFAIGAYNFSFVLVKANALGVDQATVPLVYAVLNVATVITGLPSGLLADRIGKDKVLIGAFGLFALSTVASILTTRGVVLAFGIAFIYGLYLGTSDTVQRAVIPSLTAGELKGTAYALYYLLLGVCSLVANFLFGALWDQVSSTAAFSYSLVTSLAAVVGLTVLTVSWSKTRSPVPVAN
ncbi:MAG TPA: MFS transporter, partial [Candidatus Bathyarchaeia archaeon]